MKRHFHVLVFALGIPLSAMADDPHDEVGCGEPVRPLLSVADFDGDGHVDRHDLKLLKAAIKSGVYYAFYDRNGDHVLNGRDMAAAARDLGKQSTALDRELVQAFQRFGQFQSVRTPEELARLGFAPGTQTLQGHGVHWLSATGAAATQGLIPADKFRADGLNVTMQSDAVWGMFWGSPTQPLFEDPAAASGLSALDYPAPGGIWESKRVQAFADMPPTFFSSAQESWHPHPGLCAVVEDNGQGPQIVVHQQLSFAECQALPSLGRTGIVYPNAWMNFWMLHLWLFELNPNGPFANVHPCLEPDAPPEHVINDGRVVPPFFQMQ